MKFVFGLLALGFVSLPCGACPDLTGKFICTYDNGSVDELEIQQYDLHGITTYTVNKNPVVADGVTKHLIDIPTAKNQQVTFSCEGSPSKLKHTYHADIFEQNIFAGSVVAELYFSKDSQEHLVIEDRGAFTLVTDGSLYPWEVVTLCPSVLNGVNSDSLPATE